MNMNNAAAEKSNHSGCRDAPSLPCADSSNPVRLAQGSVTEGSGQNARATVARAFCPPPLFTAAAALAKLTVLPDSPLAASESPAMWQNRLQEARTSVVDASREQQGSC